MCGFQLRKWKRINASKAVSGFGVSPGGGSSIFSDVTQLTRDYARRDRNWLDECIFIPPLVS